MEGLIMRFEKVSFEQFKKDYLANTICVHDHVDAEIEQMYNELKIPRRATIGSAGYDFYLPCDLILDGGSTALIPTGIKVALDRKKVLQIFPRSGLGFKFGIHLVNTVGIIDADYYNNESNEGHIMIKIHNPSNRTLELKRGDAFSQGIIMAYFIVEDDSALAEIRHGGLGSTDA